MSDIRTKLALLTRNDLDHEAVIREAVNYIDKLEEKRGSADWNCLDIPDIVVDISQEFDLPVDMTMKIVKQIRQQIGRELLNEAYMINKQREVVEAWYIREVCQMEES